jgi:predicted nucleotidyltransferase
MSKIDPRLNKIIKTFLQETQKIHKIDDAYLYGSYAKGIAG